MIIRHSYSSVYSAAIGNSSDSLLMERLHVNYSDIGVKR